MKDFATGGAIAALGLLYTIAFSAIHPTLPFIGLGLFLVVCYVKFLKNLVAMIKRGEIPSVNFYSGF
jgi:hypothetical protein